MTKPRLYQLEKNCNPEEIICKHFQLEWEDKLTLLGIDIDIKLEEMDLDFEKVHAKASSMTGGQ